MRSILYEHRVHRLSKSFVCQFALDVFAFTFFIFMIIPIYVGVELLGWGLYACWIILTLYVLTLFSVSLLRYRQGKWQSIRLIQIGGPVDPRI
jgi:hypothetical protein